MNFNTEWEKRRLTTPRTAAIAGILFGLLFSASLVLMRTAIPGEHYHRHHWISHGLLADQPGPGPDAVRRDRLPVVHRRRARQAGRV